MKNILFIADLCSDTLINEIHSRTGKDPGYAVQKFNRLLCKGFIKNNCKVSTLTNPIIGGLQNKWINFPNETEDGIKYNYIPFVNIPGLKHLIVFLHTFFYVLGWGLKNRRDKVVVCDVLKISGCMGALAASFFNRTKVVGVVTDIYGFMAGDHSSFKHRMAEKVSSWYIAKYDYYVLLTEAMNDLVNPKQKPYIVMEALCDNAVSDDDIKSSTKSDSKVVLYAGGLHEKYGLKMLVDAFVSLNRSDARLVLYGSGPFVPELQNVCSKYSCVEYRGIAPNAEVVKAELAATLLVNPRFTTSELTKYSFPSKNMEYMTTATPLLTTKLPGMPVEYNDFVYLFDEETVDGFATKIKLVLDKSQEELSQKGFAARHFVLSKKNNLVQTQRILNMVFN